MTRTKAFSDADTEITGSETSLAEFVWVWNRIQGQGTPRHHVKMARWLQARWSGPRREGLLMAFRNSGKSTLVGLFCAWALWCRPESRILVMAADHGLAKKMVRNVKRIIERHPLTSALIPQSRDQWASDQFTVARPGELRDPSMLAKGIGGNITGSRADVVICDDVEVPKTCDTANKRADLRARLAELDYVLVPGGMQLYIGTPHSFYSLYARTPCKEEGEDKPFLDGFSRLEIPLLDAKGLSAWPERFPPPKIEALRRRTGPNKFRSQMLLQPVDLAEGRLDPTALRLYQGELDYSEANGYARLFLQGRRLVSVSCCWDPAYGVGSAGDGSVIACVYTDEQGEYWLHAVRYLTKVVDEKEDVATSQCRQVAAFVRRHFLPAVRVEINGLGRFLPSLLRKVLGEEDVGASVIEVSARKPKDQRILEGFDAVLAAGVLHAHQSVYEGPFVAEMRQWRPGGGGHDDGLDAVAACLLAEPVRLSCGAARSRQGGWRQRETYPGGDWDYTFSKQT